MKFLKCKQDGKIVCGWCKTYFTVGEHMVGIFYAKTDGAKRIMIFLTDCYKAWILDRFDKSYGSWLEAPEKQVHTGGKKAVYTDDQRLEINKLQTLVRYYRNKGNNSLALSVALQLEDIRGKNKGADAVGKDTLSTLPEENPDEGV